MNGNPYYALVGEDVTLCLPDDRIYVFLSEEERAEAFEKLTRYTWEQFLDGEYKYDDIQSGFFYRAYDGILGEVYD